MTEAAACQTLIEGYLKARGYRRFRAADGECVITVASEAGSFPLYLRPSASSAPAIKVRARSGRAFPHAERVRLLEAVNRFNDHNGWLTASVRDTADGARLRVVGNSRFAVDEDTDMQTFSRFVDRSMVSAVILFEAIQEEMKLPSPQELKQWFERTS